MSDEKKTTAKTTTKAKATDKVTTTKTSAKAKATTKTVVDKVDKAIDDKVDVLIEKKIDEAIEEKVSEAVQSAKIKKAYTSGDRIPCQSVTAGKLVYFSTKTQERYEWTSYGDETEVLYEDLLSMKSAKSNFLFKPLFVVTDENLMSQSAWSKVKEVYNKIEIVEDAEDYFKQTPERLKELLVQAPEGLRSTIKLTASKMIKEGELDSISQIRVLDEILGTSFTSFID